MNVMFPLGRNMLRQMMMDIIRANRVTCDYHLCVNVVSMFHLMQSKIMSFEFKSTSCRVSLYMIYM